MGKQRTRRQQGAERRDERNTKGEQRQGKRANARDTKRWCYGKEGRAHKLEVGPWPRVWRFATPPPGKELYCSACGKVLDYWPGDKGILACPAPEWAQ